MRGEQRRQHPVRPERLSIIQLRQSVLSDISSELLRHDQRQEAMERLAGCLQERLYQLLKGTPDKLVMQVGSLACFREPIGRAKTGREQQAIGVEPAGWRGFRAKYPVRDGSGGITALRQLALEGALYDEAIDDTNPWFEAEEIIGDPYVAIIRNRKPVRITPRKLSDIGSNLNNDSQFPDDLILGDPVLTLQAGPRPEDRIVYPVRDLAFAV
ncbi:MAG TPA: hypothetical protein VK712_02680 [Verrucomicrobiae bacterium]|nr:hypothetical protein [Verrucomicrobiae bacterium]